MRIAMLEDDSSQALVLEHCLRRAGHQVYHYDRGEALVDAFDKQVFDVLLLDWEVPGMSGMEVLHNVRTKFRSSVPALMVTSRTSEDDIVYGLRQGADDYVGKPYRHAELIARVASVVRRRGDESEPPLEISDICVDFAARRIHRAGEVLALSTKDFELGVFFLRNVGRLLSRRQIQLAVWGSEAAVTSRTLDTHVSRFRKNLGLSPTSGWSLVAVYGYGYRLARR